MSCEPSHWNMLTMLINLPAQGNELWTQPWKYIDYANKFTSPGKWAVNPAIEICWLCQWIYQPREMSCEPSHWNMLIMLINLPAQGNELLSATTLNERIIVQFTEIRLTRCMQTYLEAPLIGRQYWSFVAISLIAIGFAQTQPMGLVI